MHFVFFMYGIKEKVDFAIMEMQHTKLPLRIYKKDNPNQEPDKQLWMQCHLRQLPAGAYEFVFPKEFQNEALRSFGCHIKQYPQYDFSKGFNLGFMEIKPLDMLRKFLHLEPVPEVTDGGQMLPMLFQDVVFIPIGVRYDAENESVLPDLKGWWHESI